MKKSLLTLTAVLAYVCFSSNAMPLTPEQALQRIRHSSPSYIKGVNYESTTPVITVNHKGTPAIYVFNKADNNGFLVLSADDTSMPILGFCDSGYIPSEASQLPDGLSYWLECLAEEVNVNASNTLKYITKPSSQSTYPNIAPLVTTQWNQDAPYNAKCPTVNGQSTYTGCGATALAQVLKYYNTSINGKGTYSYTWNNKTLSFNYGTTTFDWANMLDSYSNGYTQAQADAVATLMYACGVAIDMNYGTSASGAYPSAMPEALVRNFGFQEGARMFDRRNYSLDNWNELVYTQIRDFGPLAFSGFNTTSGHSFVCDGYQDGYYHFNWGWGGMSDGYFLLTALNPGSQGIGGSLSGYTMNQLFLGNVTVTPKTMQPSFYMAEGFTMSPDSGTAGITSFTVSGFAANDSGRTLKAGSCILGLQLRPSSGNGETQYVKGRSIEELEQGYGYKQYTVKISSDLPDGTYIATPAFQTVSDGKWHDVLIQLGAEYPYYTLVKSGTSIKAAPGEAAQLTVTSFTLDTPVYTDCKFLATAKVSNNTSAEYLNNLCVAFVTESNSVAAQSMAYPLDLAGGDSMTVNFQSDLLTAGSFSAGTYSMYLCEENGNSLSILAGPISVKISGTAPTPTLAVPTFTVANDQPLNNVVMNGTLQCTSGYFYDSIVLAVFYKQANIYQVDSDVIMVGNISGSSLNMPSSVPFTFTANLESLREGDTAQAAIYCRASSGYKQLSNAVQFRVGTPTGIEMTFVGDDTVISREYVTLQGISVGEKPNRPGMYILRETMNSGRINARRVMIR